jgi:site-specific recombinase XerD
MHPDFETLADSWELALGADGYSPRTLTNYRQALTSFSRWMQDNHPDLSPTEATRDHIRGWLVHLRDTVAQNSARSWFAGVRHFCRWMIQEGECTDDATLGIRTPRPGDPRTPVLKPEEIKAMLGTCDMTSFRGRRDAALILILADGGLRLAEVAGLTVDDVDIRDRVLFVVGKGSNRSGPRRRAAPLGIKAARALDRYLRERRKHPYQEQKTLWLGDRNRPTLSAHGITAVLKRRAAMVGLTVHPHMFRHTWASEFRSAGGEEGDLMALGGWRSRQMLDRYGKTAAADRARASYRQRSLGDRL